MERSATIENIAAALALAQGELEAVTKDSENPHFQHKYAGLSAVYKALRAPFARNGLAVVQSASSEGQRITISTMLLHKSGEFLSSDLGMTSASLTAQAVGGTITYGRRYALLAMAGLAPEDDDGEAAMARNEAKQAAASVAERKIRALKDSGLKKAVPPEIPPMSPEESLGVGPHDISLEDRLQASVRQAEAKKEKSKFVEMLENFAHLKGKCSDLGQLSLYYGPLDAHRYKHANEIKNMEEARAIYKEIAALYRDAAGRVDEVEAMREMDVKG